MGRAVAVVLLAIACGDSGGTPTDASGEVDADPNVRGTVIVKLVDWAGAPVPGLHVVFLDTDETTTDRTSDADGTASADVYPGASVTAVRPSDAGDPTSLTTVQSVVPGDTITLVTLPPAADSSRDAFSAGNVSLDDTAAGNFTFNWTAVANVQNYTILTPCSEVLLGNVTTVSPFFLRGCVKSPFDVMVIAGPPSYGCAEGVNLTYADGGSFTLPNTWQAQRPLDVTYTNVPADVSGMEIFHYAPYVRGDGRSKPVSPAAGMATAMITTCPTTRAAIRTEATKGSANQRLTQAIDGTQTSYTLDIGGALLPWVSASYDAASTTAKVTVTGTGTIDLFEAHLDYLRSGTDGYTWRVFGPQAGDVKFPTLPSTIPGDPTVRATDTLFKVQARLCETDAATGYRDAIKDVYTTITNCESSAVFYPPDGVKPATGTMNRLSLSN